MNSPDLISQIVNLNSFSLNLFVDVLNILKYGLALINLKLSYPYLFNFIIFDINSSI